MNVKDFPKVLSPIIYVQSKRNPTPLNHDKSLVTEPQTLRQVQLTQLQFVTTSSLEFHKVTENEIQVVWLRPGQAQEIQKFFTGTHGCSQE